MASATYRMHQKLSDGTYQAIHAETESGVVLRPNGDTVEKTLRQCVLAEDAGGNVPGFIVDADTLDGSTKEEIISAAQSGVDLSNVDAKTLEGKSAEEVGAIGDKTVFGYAVFSNSNWVVSGSVYSQTQNLDGVSETMRYEPEIRLVPASGSSALSSDEIAGFGLLDPIGTTGNGTLTLKTKGTDIPSVNLRVLLVGEKV